MGRPAKGEQGAELLHPPTKEYRKCRYAVAVCVRGSRRTALLIAAKRIFIQQTGEEGGEEAFFPTDTSRGKDKLPVLASPHGGNDQFHVN